MPEETVEQTIELMIEERCGNAEALLKPFCHPYYQRMKARRRLAAKLEAQLAQPALLTDRIQPVRRLLLRLPRKP